MVVVSACTALPTDGPPRGGPGGTLPSSLRIGLTSSGSLDPREVDTPESLLMADQIFDGLIAYDPSTGAAMPSVAERWDVLDDGRRFTFHLREGLTFHDGTPMAADRFVYAWNRVADPGRPSPYAFLLEHVEGYRAFHVTLEATELTGVRATGPTTLEVTLTRPWPDFVAVLGHPALSPLPVAADEGAYSLQPIGNGPYRVTAQAAPGTPVSLERYEGYLGPSPSVTQAVFTFHATPEEAWPRFLSGDLDVAPIPGAVLTDALGTYGDRGAGPVGRVLSCGFNQRIARLRSADLREAFSLAIDREALVEAVYGGLAEPAASLVPPGIPGHQDRACGSGCRLDRDRAAGLVEGLPEDARRVGLDYSESAVGDKLADALAEQMAQVGLELVPRAHDEASLETLVRDGKHELFCVVWVGDYPRQQAFLEPLLYTDAADNHAAVSDEGLDDLLDQARSAQDPGRREARYQEAERVALDDLAVVPLAWFRARYAVKQYVDGFVLDPLGGFDVARLRIAG